MIRVLSLLFVLLIGSTALSRSYLLKQGSWEFRGHPVAYERATGVSGPSSAAPLLLLNGFGVGSFHQHKLVSELLKNDQYEARSIYCIDYLGQGRSWPVDCQDGNGPTESGLRYCGSTWVQQVLGFIEEVIIPEEGCSKVHIAGNSVGGHLAVFVAATRPDLVESLGLLNATPVWGLNLPGWSGHLPAPVLPKLVGRYLFDKIRDLKTIEQYLATAYVNRDAFDQDLMEQIRSCTTGSGGHAAFASIMWSPPITTTLPNQLERVDFYGCLASLQCDVLLLFGRDDPWCKPAIAQRMLRLLEGREGLVQRYVELASVGHCPNHEAPKSVSKILSAWLTDPRQSMSAADCRVQESWGVAEFSELTSEAIPTTFVDKLAASFL